MRKSLAAFIVIWSALGSIAASVGPAAAADTRVIKAVSLTWTSNGRSSQDDGTPLIVDGLNIGDVVEIQIGPGILARLYYHQAARRCAGQRDQGPRAGVR